MKQESWAYAESLEIGTEAEHRQRLPLGHSAATTRPQWSKYGQDEAAIRPRWGKMKPRWTGLAQAQDRLFAGAFALSALMMLVVRPPRGTSSRRLLFSPFRSRGVGSEDKSGLVHLGRHALPELTQFLSRAFAP